MSEIPGDRPPSSGPTPPPPPPPPPPMPPMPPMPPPPGGTGGAGVNQPWDDVPTPAGALVLHEMGLGEILDSSIKIYRANWQVLASIVAVFIVPLQIILAVALAAGSTAGIVVATVAQVIIGPVLGGAVAKTAGELYLGRTPDLGTSLSFAFRRIGGLLLVGLLTGLAFMLGLILLVIPGLILIVRLYFGSIVVVLEGTSATDGMRRSFELTKGRFWSLAGAGIVIGFLTFIVSAIVAIPFAALGGIDNLFMSLLGDTIATILVTPFGSVAAVLLYFDLRIRKEAFDLEILAGHLGEAGQTTW